MRYQYVNHKEFFILSCKVYLFNGASSMLLLCGITRHAVCSVHFIGTSVTWMDKF